MELLPNEIIVEIAKLLDCTIVSFVLTCKRFKKNCINIVSLDYKNKWGTLLINIVSKEYFDLMKWAIENNYRDTLYGGITYSVYVCDLEITKWLLDNNYGFSGDSLILAVRNNNLDFIKFIHSYFEVNKSNKYFYNQKSGKPYLLSRQEYDIIMVIINNLEHFDTKEWLDNYEYPHFIKQRRKRHQGKPRNQSKKLYIKNFH